MKTKDGKEFRTHGTYYYFDQKAEDVFTVYAQNVLDNSVIHGTGDVLISELYQSRDIAISDAKEYFKQKIQGYQKKIETLETEKDAGNR